MAGLTRAVEHSCCIRGGDGGSICRCLTADQVDVWTRGASWECNAGTTDRHHERPIAVVFVSGQCFGSQLAPTCRLGHWTALAAGQCAGEMENYQLAGSQGLGRTRVSDVRGELGHDTPTRVGWSCMLLSEQQKSEVIEIVSFSLVVGWLARC
jgi:hypothetical protein